MASEEEPLTIDGSHSLDIHSLNAPDEQEELEASSTKKRKTEQLSDEVTSEATEEPHTLTQNPPPFTGHPVSSTNELSDEAAYEANEEPDTLMQRPTPCGAQPVSSNVEIYVETVEADEGFSRQRKHSTQHVGQPESADNQEEDHVMPESESDSTKKKEFQVNNCKKNISPPTEEIINNTGNHPCGVAETNVIEVPQETLKYNQQQTPDASQSAANISKRPDIAPAHNTVDTGSNTTSGSDYWRQDSQQPSPLSASYHGREGANNEGSSHSQAARNGPSSFPETERGARKQPQKTGGRVSTAATDNDQQTNLEVKRRTSGDDGQPAMYEVDVDPHTMTRYRGSRSSPQLRNEGVSQVDTDSRRNIGTNSPQTVTIEGGLREDDPQETLEVVAEGLTMVEESIRNEPIETDTDEQRPQQGGHPGAENPYPNEGNLPPANGSPRGLPNVEPCHNTSGCTTTELVEELVKRFLYKLNERCVWVGGVGVLVSLAGAWAFGWVALLGIPLSAGGAYILHRYYPH